MSLLDSLQIPTSTLDVFIRTVEVSSYIPGRARLYSRRLVGNPALAREVEARLLAFAEIDAAATNETTGSILIQYEPARLRQNAKLRKVEDYIKTHVRRK
ncbi:HMA2 domain-containing protein [Mitsuokella sp. oral taxon 131]|uniref:HMA2 domain-containing protein n=1 Tax=Mitsuokella sp. oral taxon 131 TaxID=1321780 RepID=UPI0004158B5B|nr:hypothetical protein [Mitsuokella sp. oral taxon 131]